MFDIQNSTKLNRAILTDTYRKWMRSLGFDDYYPAMVVCGIAGCVLVYQAVSLYLIYGMKSIIKFD